MKKGKKNIIILVVALVLIIIIGVISEDGSNKSNENEKETLYNVKETTEKETTKKQKETTTKQKETTTKKQKETTTKKQKETTTKETTEKETTTKETTTVNNNPVPLQIAEVGYTVNPVNSIGDVYATYGIKIINPNSNVCPSSWKLNITIKSPDGTILGAEDAYIPAIAPNDYVYMGDDLVNCKGASDAILEFSLTGADFAKPENLFLDTEAKSSDFTYANINEIADTFDTSITGEITNNTSEDVNSANFCVVFRNAGQIVGGSSSYIDDIPTGQTIAFECSLWGDIPVHDSIDYYTNVAY